MAMSVCVKKTPRQKNAHFLLLVILSLGIFACQTTEQNRSDKTQEIINSQKAIVHNALDNGNVKAAYQTMRGLVQHFPNDASVQNLMGLTQLAMKNSSRAIRHFQNAYKIDRNPGSALNLSSAYIDTGDYNKAISVIKNVMATKEAQNYQYKERFYHNLGYSYAKLKKNTKAENFYKQALEENPSFYPTHLELARIERAMGRPASAIHSYRLAIDYCHVCLDPVSELTTMYVKAGKIRDARDILIKFSKIDGINERDRKKAVNLLNIVTAAKTPKNKTF